VFKILIYSLSQTAYILNRHQQGIELL